MRLAAAALHRYNPDGNLSSHARLVVPQWRSR